MRRPRGSAGRNREIAACRALATLSGKRRPPAASWNGPSMRTCIVPPAALSADCQRPTSIVGPCSWRGPPLTDFLYEGLVGHLVGHLGRVAGPHGCPDYTDLYPNAPSGAAAPPGTTRGCGPQPQSSRGCGPQPRNGSPYTTPSARGTRKADSMTGKPIWPPATQDLGPPATAMPRSRARLRQMRTYRVICPLLSLPRSGKHARRTLALQSR
jgi:hypothetical protein